MKTRTAQVCLALLLASPTGTSESLAFNEVKPEFGPVGVGKSSEPKIISISNVSSAPIFFLHIKVTEDFTQSNMCPIWLPEGSGCLVFITFSPVAGGLRAGQLCVDWVGGGKQAISLNGLGVSAEDSHDATVVTTAEGVGRTTNDEEIANRLINDKRYTFEALLKRSPPDVANSEKIFALTKDTERKERIASILLSIGVSEPIYFDYLTDQARKTLAHDADIPQAYLYGEDGQPKSINPEVNEWCKKHDMSFGDMHSVSYLEMPIAWYFLAAASDPSAYDLLTKGLHSTNVMIVAMAAQGLAMLGDPRAIDELIATGRAAPAEARGSISEALLFFHDPRAQTAAEEILPDKEKHMVEVWRRDIKARGLRALFQW